MLPYLFPIILAFIGAYIIRNLRLTVYVFMSAAWVLLAFRNLEMGMRDTMGTYFDLFNYVRTVDFLDIVFGHVETDSSLFALSMKLYQQIFGMDYQGYIALISMFIMFCFARFLLTSDLIEDSTGAFLACVVLYVTIFPFTFSLIRQMTALAILLVGAYLPLQNKNLLGFVVGTIFAGLIHSTAFVFLLLYPCTLYLTPSKRILIVVIFISFVGILFPHLVMNLLSTLPFLSTRMRYIQLGIYSADTQGLGYGTLLLWTFLLVLFYILLSERSELAIHSNLFWMLSFAVVFQGWSHTVVEFYRVAMYFSASLSVLVTLLPFRRMRDRSNELLDVAICVLCLFYFYGSSAVAGNILPYSFF